MNGKQKKTAYWKTFIGERRALLGLLIRVILIAICLYSGVTHLEKFVIANQSWQLWSSREDLLQALLLLSVGTFDLWLISVSERLSQRAKVLVALVSGVCLLVGVVELAQFIFTNAPWNAPYALLLAFLMMALTLYNGKKLLVQIDDLRYVVRNQIRHTNHPDG